MTLPTFLNSRRTNESTDAAYRSVTGDETTADAGIGAGFVSSPRFLKDDTVREERGRFRPIPSMFRQQQQRAVRFIASRMLSRMLYIIFPVELCV